MRMLIVTSLSKKALEKVRNRRMKCRRWEIISQLFADNPFKNQRNVNILCILTNQVKVKSE